jgi:hypothetical protein
MTRSNQAVYYPLLSPPPPSPPTPLPPPHCHHHHPLTQTATVNHDAETASLQLNRLTRTHTSRRGRSSTLFRRSVYYMCIDSSGVCRNHVMWLKINNNNQQRQGPYGLFTKRHKSERDSTARVHHYTTEWYGGYRTPRFAGLAPLASGPCKRYSLFEWKARRDRDGYKQSKAAVSTYHDGGNGHACMPITF